MVDISYSYGLLFEGDPKAESCESSNTSNVQHINSSCRANVIPNWFCLLHPLDDFTQVSKLYSAKLMSSMIKKHQYLDHDEATQRIGHG